MLTSCVGRNTTLDNNRVLGVTVAGENSDAEFRFPTVTNTRLLGGSEEAMVAACGFNAVLSVVVRDGAIMTMSGTANNPFLIANSDLAGFVIAGPAVPELHLSDGVVRSTRHRSERPARLRIETERRHRRACEAAVHD